MSARAKSVGLAALGATLAAAVVAWALPVLKQWLALLDGFAGPVGPPIVILGLYSFAGLVVAATERGERRLTRLNHAKTIAWSCFALGLLGTYLAVTSLGAQGQLDTGAIIQAMGSSLMGLSVFFATYVVGEMIAPGRDSGGE